MTLVNGAVSRSRSVVARAISGGAGTGQTPLVSVPEQRSAEGGEEQGLERPDLLVAGTQRARRERERKAERSYVTQLRITDAWSAGMGGLVGCGVALQADTTPAYVAASIVFPVLWVIAVGLARAYEPRFLFTGGEEFRRVTNAAVGVAVGGSLVAYALRVPLSRGYFLALVTATLCCSLGGRYVSRAMLRRRRSAGIGWMRRIIVAGHEDEVRDVVAEFRRSRSHGYEVAGVCMMDDLSTTTSFDVPVTVGMQHAAAAARALRADAVVVLSCHHLGPSAVRRLGWELERSNTELLLAPGLLDVAHRRATLHPAGSLALLHVHHAELSGARRIVKELFDRTMAALAVILLAPLLGLLMLAVRLDSSGPALFRQERVGRDNGRFMLLKLRTMVVDAEERREDLLEHNEGCGVLFKMKEDPRVTRVGRVLRRYSLDELPQLVNVMLGHMSLVGPRPPLPDEAEAYEHDVRRRMGVKPGITGLWQVSGRSDLTWDESVRLDLQYVENWSLALDLMILWRTGRAVLAHSGAY